MSEQNKTKTNNVLIIQITLIVILVAFLMYSLGKDSATGNIPVGLTGAAVSDIIPTGTPAIYGEKLGITFDAVSADNPRSADATISVLKDLDNSITLEGANLERYIEITSKISCEYCCGAKSIIFSDGKAACGCAHSYAMRGLSKYLISEYPNDFSDDEVLAELGKWKVLFFPGIHEQKAAVMASQGIDTNYINLASNKYRGIEKGQSSGGGMVGGC